MNSLELDRFLMAALAEDIGPYDVTTDSCVPEGSVSRGALIAKEAGVICGLDVAARVFSLLDECIEFSPKVKDGEAVKEGEVISEFCGNSRALLKGERVALNLLQHMSGIATRTAEAVAAIAGTKSKIVDTRKTLPGLRALEKYAVRTGGGSNHRFGLYDGVLIKDNHIAAAGGIKAAVKAARGAAAHTLKIEVEVENMPQVLEALEAGADIIMLDNMSVKEMAEAVSVISGRALTEASGNMGSRSLLEIAQTGVDFISIGALTHSVKAMDISMRFL